MTNTDINNKRYWAYSNYLIAIDKILQQEYPNEKSLVDKTVKSRGFNKIQGKNIDYEILGKILRHCWFTELLLAKKVPHSDLLRFALPWSMVEIYYSILFLLNAYFFTFNKDLPTSHAGFLNTISSDISTSTSPLLPPWNSFLINDPAKIPLNFKNFPFASITNFPNPLCSPEDINPWLSYGLFLKTTRKKNLDKNIKNWKKENNRRRILSTERITIINRLRATTFFDCIYRLRIRSNYEDIDSFAFCNAQSYDFEKLHKSICNINYYTSLLFELLIYRSIGKMKFQLIYENFVSTLIGNLSTETIIKRWGFINNCF